MARDHTAYKVPPLDTLGYNVVRGIFLPTLPTSPYITHKVVESKKNKYIKRHVLQRKELNHNVV